MAYIFGACGFYKVLLNEAKDKQSFLAESPLMFRE